MVPSLICAVGLLLPGVVPDTPIAWSPDGRWAVYVLASRAPGEMLTSAWLFPAPEGAAPAAAPSARTYRVWATQPATGESTLLEESPWPVSSACWKPDGTALAYARLGGIGTPRARIELVVQDNPERRRVLWEQPLDRPPQEALDLVGATRVTWSPNGQFLAVPVPAPAGIAFLRADSGRLLKVIEGARAVSWSPDGGRVAFYRGDALYWIDSNFGELRHLTDTASAEVLPPPIWTRDGQAVLCVVRGKGPGVGPMARRGPITERADLVRARIDTRQVESIRSLVHEPFTEAAAMQAVAYSFDTDQRQLFYTTVVDRQRTQVTWVFPRENVVRSRFNPVDEWAAITNLSPSPPEAARLGLRVGLGGPASLVAVCEPAGQGLTPLMPDDASRLEWVGFLLDTIAEALRTQPARTADGTRLERATLLPAPSEWPALAPILPRLRGLARIGLAARGQPEAGQMRDPAVQGQLDEAQLVFAYLNDDEGQPASRYRAALAALDTVERRATSTDQRFRLLALRAQIELGLGDQDRARASLACLRGARPGPAEQIEETATGFALTSANDPLSGWLSFLERDAERKPATPGEPAEDEPQPGLGLEPAPPPAALENRIDVVRPPGQNVPF